MLLILDFGSQFTQLIARRIREQGVYCEILPANTKFQEIKNRKPEALILSGGPHSVFDKKSPKAGREILQMDIPVLGICYGMQWMAQVLGGRVEPAQNREYGLMEINISNKEKSVLFRGAKGNSLNTWMSHGDEVKKIPAGFLVTAKSSDGSIAAIEFPEKKLYALQFHPEVTHTENGRNYFVNFLSTVKAKTSWTLSNFCKEKISEIRAQVGDVEQAICALSGGVDSTVAATMVEKAIPGRLTCFYIDSGLQREGEVEEVLSQVAGLRVQMINARKEFMQALKGVKDPERKRKIIGRIFIEIFQREAKRIGGKKNKIQFLVQGTLYPDVIESMPPPGRGGFSHTIKSHHNVGGLPKKMHMQLIEPLRELFKDEVRTLGKELGISDAILKRHPFPGPGLAIRCLGEVNEDRLKILRAADKIYISILRKHGLYDKIWQAGTILLPLSTVGVMGDGRTYENPIAIRAVTSDDGMTANWYPFSPDVLSEISSRIVNEVKGVNRVVYDISTKPPATIEWE